MGKLLIVFRHRGFIERLLTIFIIIGAQASKKRG